MTPAQFMREYETSGRTGEPVFMHYGFIPLSQRLLRRTLARNITIAQAAAFRGVRPHELLDSLNRAAHPETLVQLTIANSRIAAP
jgi:hypothetical protein